MGAVEEPVDDFDAHLRAPAATIDAARQDEIQYLSPSLCAEMLQDFVATDIFEPLCDQR